MINILLLNNVLKDYERIAATDGYQALELARKSPQPDLILLDIMMPGLDGYEVCRELKADPQTRDILVIFVTAMNEEDSETFGFELGAVDYITKPFQVRKVQARMKTHLGYQRSRRQLQEEKQKLQKAESLALLGTWEWDIVKDIWYVSENWKLIHGVKKDCLSSSELKEIAHPNDLHLVEKFLQKAKEEGKYELKHRILRKYSKEERHIQAFGEVEFCKKTKKPLRMLGAAQDITEKVLIAEALEGSQHRYRFLAENSEDVIWTMDAEHRTTYVSPSIERLLGYSPQEYMQIPLQRHFTPESFEIVKENMKVRQEALLAGQVDKRAYRMELEQYRKDGTRVWTEVLSNPIFDSEDNMLGIVGNTRDITEKKELETLKEDVERIMRHDLKTPLNSIIGYPQILLYDKNLSEEQVDIIKDIEDSGKQMLNMIDLSLDMFKMETGRYDYQPQEVDLIAVLCKVVEHTRSYLSFRKITFDIQI